MRISIWVLLFLLSLNAWAGLLQTTGIAQSHGISVQLGNTDKLDQAEEEAKTVGSDSGSSIGGTLLGLITTATNTVTVLFDAVFIGPTMLKNVIPGETAKLIVDFITAGLVIIVGIDIINLWRPGGLD